jgi:hypothetical protein
MKSLYKFFRLSSSDQGLLIKATFTAAAIRVGLWMLPFRTLLGLLARMTQESTEVQETNQALIERVIWAVRIASRFVPRATCLTQALAAQVLLSLQGYPSRITIGVAKSHGGQLEAHAWVESQGRIVIGGLKDHARFTPLPPLDGERA